MMNENDINLAFCLLLFLPLIGFVSVFFLSFLTDNVSCYVINSILIWISFFSSLVIFGEMNYMPNGSVSFIFNLGNWLTVGQASIEWEFLFDYLSAFMAILITFISAIIHFYSCFYLLEDPHRKKFIAFLSLFTFFMLFLVLAGNFLILFIGWEGVGLSSYLLINFWYTRTEANRAGFKALFMNRVGDLFFLLALSIIFATFKTFDFRTVWTLIEYITDADVFIFYNIKIKWIELVCFCLLIAAAAKSAQLFFHTWLADAMEGPTPVSALLHSATMVTAGIFLILRCSFLFVHAPNISHLMLLWGGLTTIISGLIASNQWDIKKIIAYSTCSQLGLMFVACGLQCYSLALFHLITHAFSKALLFLGSGLLIHMLSNEQDIRQMGSALNFAPFIYTIFIYSNLSLMGFPFTPGFYSKELIFNALLMNNLTKYDFIVQYLIYTLSICLTVYYSIRLMYYVFWRPYSGQYKIISQINTTIPFYIQRILMLLFFASIFVGRGVRIFFISYGPIFYDSLVLGAAYSSEIGTAVQFLFPVIWGTMTFIIFGYLFIITSLHIPKNMTAFKTIYLSKWIEIHRLLNQGFYIDQLYNIIGTWILDFGTKLHYGVEKGILELFGPTGLDRLFLKISSAIHIHQAASIHQHLIIMFVNIILFLIVVILCIFFNF
jgi:NADH-quinone oxidoreductase subunit L